MQSVFFFFPADGVGHESHALTQVFPVWVGAFALPPFRGPTVFDRLCQKIIECTNQAALIVDGSIRMPGLMVVLSVMLFTYCPLAEEGLALMIASRRRLAF